MIRPVTALNGKEIGMQRSGPKKYPEAPTTWEDVWYWGREIEKRWVYDLKVTVHPPLNSQTGQRFVVMVELTKLKVNDPNRQSTMTKWRGVEGRKLTAEVIALQMLVEMHRDLDNEELDRERAALAAGAMF